MLLDSDDSDASGSDDSDASGPNVATDRREAFDNPTFTGITGYPRPVSPGHVSYGYIRDNSARSGWRFGEVVVQYDMFERLPSVKPLDNHYAYGASVKTPNNDPFMFVVDSGSNSHGTTRMNDYITKVRSRNGQLVQCIWSPRHHEEGILGRPGKSTHRARSETKLVVRTPANS